jgi:hypothetical protein
MIGGAVVAIAGTGLGIFEMTRVPSNCSVSTHQCAAPPGDPSISSARSAMETANIGWMVGAVGVAALAGGITWYVTGSKTEKEHLAVAPWASPTGGGFAIGGSL